MGTIYIYIYTYSMTSDGLIMVNGYKVTVFLSTDVAGGESFALEHLKKYMELGNTGKTMGKPWETMGKQWGNPGKPWETMGKLWENSGATQKNNGKTMGKPWENGICG